MVNLAQDLELRARESAAEFGLAFEDGRRWTYGELDRAAARVGQALLDSGAERGARVGLFVSNGPGLLLALFGSWKAGLVPVAMSALYNRDEAVGCLEKAAPGTVVVDETTEWFMPVAERLAGRVMRIGADLIAPDGYDASLCAPDVGADAEGVVLFTGGTTGLPKAVVLSHEGAYRNMSLLAKASKGGREGPFPPSPGSPNLLTFPLFHGGGMQAMLFSLHVGRAMVLMSRFRVDNLAALVQEFSIDNLFLLPTMIYDLVYADESVALPTVTKVLAAGQALDPGLKSAFEKRYSTYVFTNFGSAEMGHVAGWTPADVRAGLWKPGSAGRIYDGVEVEIRDDDGNVLPPGEIGEIFVRTDRTKGYLDDSVADGPLVVDGWVRSGDMGHVDPERVLFIAGRRREMIKTGGFQVWPGELEAVLRRHAAVRDVAVVGAPDARLGEIPTACVVLDQNVGAAEPALAEELIEFCRSRLAHFKAIRRVHFMESLPRNNTGKIQKGELSKLIAQSAGIAQSNTPIERNAE